MRIERNPPILRILGGGASDDDLVLRPIHLLVPNAQHLTLPAAGFDRPDDSVVHRESNPLVLGRVHRDARRKELLLLVSMESSISLVLVPALDADAETMERRR